MPGAASTVIDALEDCGYSGTARAISVDLAERGSCWSMHISALTMVNTAERNETKKKVLHYMTR
jgi:hypothetical protein